MPPVFKGKTPKRTTPYFVPPVPPVPKHTERKFTFVLPTPPAPPTSPALSSGNQVQAEILALSDLIDGLRLGKDPNTMDETPESSQEQQQP